MYWFNARGRFATFVQNPLQQLHLLVMSAARFRPKNPLHSLRSELEYQKKRLGPKDFRWAERWLTLKFVVTACTWGLTAYGARQLWSATTLLMINANEGSISIVAGFESFKTVFVIALARMMLFDFVAVGLGIALRGSDERTMFRSQSVQNFADNKGVKGFYVWFGLRGGTFVTLSALIALGQPVMRVLVLKVIATSGLIVFTYYLGGGLLSLLIRFITAV